MTSRGSGEEMKARLLETEKGEEILSPIVMDFGG